MTDRQARLRLVQAEEAMLNPDGARSRCGSVAQLYDREQNDECRLNGERAKSFILTLHSQRAPVAQVDRAPAF
jgi:hypothetical protein